MSDTDPMQQSEHKINALTEDQHGLHHDQNRRSAVARRGFLAAASGMTGAGLLAACGSNSSGSSASAAGTSTGSGSGSGTQLLSMRTKANVAEYLRDGGTWHDSPFPVVTVSPYGKVDGYGQPNNGADFGPDTSGTVTQGVVEAINYAIAQATAADAPGAPDVQLLPGIFEPTSFTNTTYRIVYPIDSGHSVSDGPPVSVTIRGTGTVMNAAEGTSFCKSFTHGATIIDGSKLDVLALGANGYYAQGRIFGVVPRLTSFPDKHPLNAVDLLIENMTIINPIYNAAGSYGAAYTVHGVSSKLFHDGDSQSSNTTHWSFVNGIDGWAASSMKVKNVNVTSALAAYNATGNQYGGASGVYPYGSGAGVVWPEDANQGNLWFECVSTYDQHVGMMIGTHVAGDQFYPQASSHCLYMRSDGHGAHVGRVNPQSFSDFIRHSQLPQLTNDLSDAYFDPVGDMYAPVGLSFPSAAGSSVLTIDEVALETAFDRFLVDDPGNPLTCMATVDYTGTIDPSSWGAGANLLVNLLDIPAHVQTVVNGTTAGSATWTQHGASPWAKRFMVYLSGYQNSTATPQVITFRHAYNHVPAIMKDDSGGCTVATTTLTLPASMESAETGYIFLEGY